MDFVTILLDFLVGLVVGGLAVNAIWFRQSVKDNKDWHDRCLKLNDEWADFCRNLNKEYSEKIKKLNVSTTKEELYKLIDYIADKVKGEDKE